MAVAARYLNRELISVFVVVIVVLLAVVVGGRFISYLQDAAAGKYSADSLLTIVWLHLPHFIQQVVPFAFFLAVLLTLGRFHADQEMAVLRTGGLGSTRVLMWLAAPALVLSCAVAALSLWVTPGMMAQLEEYLLEQRASEDFVAVAPGVFRTFDRGRRVTYIESVSDDRRTLERVFMSEQQPTGDDSLVWATSGSQYVDPSTGSRFLRLDSGRRYEGRVGERDYRVIEFRVLGQRLAVGEPPARRVRVEAMPTAVLRARRDGASVAELSWRYSLPLLTLISGALALGLGRVKPRQGRFARIVPGLTVYVAYFLLLIVGQNALRHGSLPTWLGLWPVHGLFLATAAVMARLSARPARL